MALTITGFDGHTLNSTTAYRVGLPYGSSAPKAVGLSLQQRASSYPSVSSMSRNAWTFQLRISGTAGAGVTYAQFRENVEQWFDSSGSRETRTLTATWHDGTAVQIDVLVQSLELTGDAGIIESLEYIATCVAPRPYWESTTLTTSASNPATVTNAGNTAALPVVELTSGTHVTRRACTVTGAGAGGGVIAYPVKFVLVNGTPVLASSTANPAVITTSSPHGLSTGNSVTIAGHSDASINGTYTITVTNTTQFTIPVNGATNGAGSGGAVALAADYDSTFVGLAEENFAVYVEGLSVPCDVTIIDGALVYVWALLDTGADGLTATNVDIVYGAGLSNPLAGTLNDAGMSWTDHGNCTNSAWEWDDWSGILSNTARTGVWRPAKTGNHHPDAAVSYGISATSTGVTFALGGEGTYDNSADSIRMLVGAKAGVTSALTGLKRVTAGLDGTNARAFVRKRIAGSKDWLDVWTSSSNATVSSNIDIDDAVEIAIGIENFGSTADVATLDISDVSAGNQIALALASTPTVVIGSATNADVHNGSLTIGDRTITFNNLIVPDGTLTVDAAARSITSSVAGPFYGDEDAIEFESADVWFALVPGSNTVTNGTDDSDVIVKFRSAFS